MRELSLAEVSEVSGGHHPQNEDEKRFERHLEKETGVDWHCQQESDGSFNCKTTGKPLTIPILHAF